MSGKNRENRLQKTDQVLQYYLSQKKIKEGFYDRISNLYRTNNLTVSCDCLPIYPNSTSIPKHSPPIYKKRGVLSCTAVEKVLATSSETVQATPTLKYFVQTKF